MLRVGGKLGADWGKSGGVIWGFIGRSIGGLVGGSVGMSIWCPYGGTMMGLLRGPFGVHIGSSGVHLFFVKDS